jgi:hypothetical protein
MPGASVEEKQAAREAERRANRRSRQAANAENMVFSIAAYGIRSFRF